MNVTELRCGTMKTTLTLHAKIEQKLILEKQSTLKIIKVMFLELRLGVITVFLSFFFRKNSYI